MAFHWPVTPILGPPKIGPAEPILAAKTGVSVKSIQQSS